MALPRYSCFCKKLGPIEINGRRLEIQCEGKECAVQEPENQKCKNLLQKTVSQWTHTNLTLKRRKNFLSERLGRDILPKRLNFNEDSHRVNINLKR